MIAPIVTAPNRNVETGLPVPTSDVIPREQIDPLDPLEVHEKGDLTDER